MIGDYEYAHRVSEIIEAVAVAAIVFAVLAAIAVGIVEMIRSEWTAAFDKFKRYMARGLLVGLDLLIAADVIKTVTVEATLENVTILGLLVLIRTFLSWSLILEVEGRWPWQSERTKTDIGPADGA